MNKIIEQLLSLSLLTMPVLVLTVHHGAGISAIIILLLSLWVLSIKYPVNISLSNKERVLIFSLVLFPIIIIFDVILRELQLRYLDYYLRFILVIPIYFALKESKSDLRPLFIGILLGSIGAGLFSLYQFSLYQSYYINIKMDRIGGYLNAIKFGNISLLLAVMSLAGLFLVKEMKFKKIGIVVCLLAFFMGLIGSILPGSRGGWLAIPFFIILFLIYTPIKNRYKLAGLVISVIIMLGPYYSNAYVEQRVNTGYTNAMDYLTAAESADLSKLLLTSAGARLEMWKAAWLIFKENPIFGVGSGNYSQELITKMDAGEIERMPAYTHAHNELLHILAITGVVGFLGYLIFYAGITYYFFSTLLESHNAKEKYLSFIGILLVVGFFIFGLTNYSFAHHTMVLFFSIMVVSLAGMIGSIERDLKTA